MGKYYFLASALPAMPASLGDKPALSFPETSGIVRRNIEPEDAPLVQALLMAVDTANFENIHQGRTIFFEGGTLSREEIEHRRGLPLFMQAFLEERDRGVRRAYLFDALWEKYYQHSYSLSQDRECQFLTGYISWEISLRNQLVMLRAKEGAREAEEYCLLPHIGGHDLSGVLAQVRNQRNPLAAERVLDEERLKRVFHCEGGDPFAVDAILGALERARIFDKWDKMSAPFRIEDVV